MKRQTHSKTSLFLMEILMTVLFFSIASAVCVQFFVKAHFISKSSTELSQAVILCENASEIYKSGDGSLDSLISVYPDAVMDGSSLILYFDKNFSQCSAKNCCYYLRIDHACDSSNCYADIFFRNCSKDHTIYKLHVTRHIPLTLGCNRKGGLHA